MSSIRSASSSTSICTFDRFHGALLREIEQAARALATKMSQPLRNALICGLMAHAAEHLIGAQLHIFPIVARALRDLRRQFAGLASTPAHAALGCCRSPDRRRAIAESAARSRPSSVPFVRRRERPGPRAPQVWPESELRGVS